MKKKTKVILIIITTLVCLLITAAITYVQVNKIIYANRVTDYLLEKQNYNSEEIEFVEGVWGKMLPAFFAVVVFKDEPEVEYIYFAHNEVMQFGYRLTEAGKQIGIEELELKHLDNR
ncbi:DUF3139 domain-containing protein [Paenibacillus physcomitrellae]|uniref:DUF3139 domain-containing protein n=1 Tax=Paenibacillus physcomitrellae TaxID=1619311 RepID=A0ABQ1FWR9_9BACL|nr:DUF3139 domain-containing protein [Paenibacillus physcomitrellae]GGA31516.1 hypothetical protein GCM10010917_15780 [Paenibacillus physcomitrellae]